MLPAACSDDSDEDKKSAADGTGTDLDGTGTGTGTTTGTSTGAQAAGTGEGGVKEIDQATWDNNLNAACNGSTNETEGGGGKLELVVDISSSMNQSAGGNQTKWEATREAIRGAIVGDANNPGLSPAVAAGMLFYPGLRIEQVSRVAQESSVCLNLEGSVDMALLTDAAKDNFSAVLDATNTGRGTPTHDAYKYALDNVILAPEQAAFSGTPTILLITDGMPTLELGCFNTTGDLDYGAVPTDPILAEIQRAAEAGVKTFAIGSPGSDEGRQNGYDWLSEAAQIGGTAKADCSNTGPNYCHMDLTKSNDFAGDLAAALKTVTSTVMSCEYNILASAAGGSDTSVVDPALTVVMASFSTGERQIILRDDSPDDCSIGWYVNADTNQVVLCPETCDKVQSDAEVTLNVMFGCTEIEVTTPATTT